MTDIFYSNSDDYTRAYYDSLLIEPRLVGADLAKTAVRYFGTDYASPIMIAPYAGEIALGRIAAEAGTPFWAVHASEDDLRTLIAEGVSVYGTSKPIADRDELCRRIRAAEEMGQKAFFIDIDHILDAHTGGWFHCHDGQDCGVQDEDALAAYAACSSLPVIIKGVLSVHDALACRKAGIAGIVVSHHHGRILYSVPPAMALERIRAAVGPDYPVFVDCGIESGIDAFKALCLGANGVLVGRHLLELQRKAGFKAVRERIAEMNCELRYYMSVTGAADPEHLDPACLIRRTY